MSHRRALVVQHHAECPPAWIGEWLVAGGCEVDLRRPYAGDELPGSLAEHDVYVVMGGPMGANDDDFTWLEPTRALVRDAVERQRPTLGICLGHQLCAVALGGRVDQNPRGQQLGLIELGWREEAASDALVGRLTDVRSGVQWNDDIVVELPLGATLLAATPAGEPQVVRHAATVWGVQLHPEVDDRVLGYWAREERERGDREDVDRYDAVVREVRAERQRLEREWRPLVQGLLDLAGA